VAVDWTQFPAHLESSLRGLKVESREKLAVGGSWAIRWKGQQFFLEAHVFRRDEIAPLSPDRVGGERSKEKVGDLLSIAMRLQKALLWDGARAPVPLAPSELHLDRRRFPELRGMLSFAEQDWESVAVSSGSPSESTWLEELRRRGLAIG
jgi:hypothetical protein